jgi:hypothetical protein
MRSLVFCLSVHSFFCPASLIVVTRFKRHLAVYVCIPPNFLVFYAVRVVLK